MFVEPVPVATIKRIGPGRESCGFLYSDDPRPALQSLNLFPAEAGTAAQYSDYGPSPVTIQPVRLG